MALLFLVFLFYAAAQVFKLIKAVILKIIRRFRFKGRAGSGVSSDAPHAVHAVSSSAVSPEVLSDAVSIDASAASSDEVSISAVSPSVSSSAASFDEAEAPLSANGDSVVNSDEASPSADERDAKKKRFKNPIFIEILNIVRVPFLTIALEFIYWLLTDLIRAVRRGKDRDVHIYGIWCFVGIYGGGKTMSLVRYLEQMKEKYGDKIYVATNFYYKNQDFAITKWQDLLKDYDKSVIFGYDELQNEFNSRKYRDFPLPLMGLLTQNRKGHGKQIVFTAQNYGAVDKNFRDLCTKVVNCKTHAGRFTVNSFYDKEYYDMLRSTVSIDRKIKIRPHREIFIQSDYLRGLYDTRKQLQSAKNSQYLGLEEMRKLNNVNSAL